MKTKSAEIIKNNSLIAKFRGCNIDYDVADWSQYNDKSLTEHWNNNDRTYLHIPKGQGMPWYKVKHRDIFYQLYTDFTFNKLKKEELELYCTYNDEYYIISDLKFHESWDWLMPVVEQIENLGHSFYIVNCNCYLNDAPPTMMGESKIHAVYLKVVEFIEWYNTKK